MKATLHSAQEAETINGGLVTMTSCLNHDTLVAIGSGATLWWNRKHGEEVQVV